MTYQSSHHCLLVRYDGINQGSNVQLHSMSIKYLHGALPSAAV